MRFLATDKSHSSISLQIDGEAIAEVNKLKFLGMIIDNKLRFFLKIKYHLCVERSRVVSGLIVQEH